MSGGRPCFPPMGEVYTVGAGLAPPAVRSPSVSGGRPASPDGGGLHRRGGACRRPLFDMCPCPTGGGSSPPYRQLAGSLPPPPPGEAEDALRRGELRSPGGGGRGGRLVAAPTGPPCHCEERSDAAIRCPSRAKPPIQHHHQIDRSCLVWSGPVWSGPVWSGSPVTAP